MLALIKDPTYTSVIMNVVMNHELVSRIQTAIFLKRKIAVWLHETSHELVSNGQIALFFLLHYPIIDPARKEYVHAPLLPGFLKFVLSANVYVCVCVRPWLGPWVM